MNLQQLPAVDRNRAIPLYYQVSEYLEEVIKRGDLRPGERLPAEEALAEKFGVSRPTINQAIEILLRKSVLSRERGKGTFVHSSEVRLTLMDELASFHEAMLRNNIPFRTAVLELQKQRAADPVATQLGIAEGTGIYYLRRLRYVEEEPFLISESFMPENLFPDLEKENFSDSSLYGVFGQKYGVQVTKTERFARAVKALDREAHLFRIPLGEPLIQLEGVAFSSGDVRVEYFNTRIRGDRGVLHATLLREGHSHSRG